MTKVRSPVIVHRKDAKDAKRSFFSLAVERTAREKMHFTWDIGFMPDILHIDREQKLVRSADEFKRLYGSLDLFAFRPLNGKQKKYINLCDLHVSAVN